MTPVNIHQKPSIDSLYGKQRIRFEQKKETSFFADHDDILFVKSADHYVRALIKYGESIVWMTRHCTLKDMQSLLPNSKFMRLNRFYVVNRDHFSYVDAKEKCLYLMNGISVPISHRISCFVISALNG